MKYYRYNHQIFRIDPVLGKYWIYNQNKKDWVWCMIFQQYAILNAIRKKRAGELDEEALFTELL